MKEITLEQNITEWTLGEIVKGKFVSLEQSKKYPDSYLLEVKKGKDVIKKWVNNIVKDKIDQIDVPESTIIEVEFLGMKKNVKGDREYRDFRVSYEE